MHVVCFIFLAFLLLFLILKICSVCLSVVVCFKFSSIANLLCRDNEHKLHVYGRLSSNIHRRPTCSENDLHLCYWGERRKCDSLQNYPQKTQNSVHSVHYVVHEEELTIKQTSSSPVLPFTFGTPRTETPILATKIKRFVFYDSCFHGEAREVTFLRTFLEIAVWCCWTFAFTKQPHLWKMYFQLWLLWVELSLTLIHSRWV